ncbi:MAG: acyl-CoA thioesterase [Micrococcales bacterium]|nr:acyl-CoA thioesterase [Micrococcales bacterium]
MKYLNKQFVRWDDIDAFGHVNNAKYLVFAQEARFHWSFVQFEGKDEQPSIVEMVVARAEVDFIEPIYEGGRFVDVHLWVDKIGTSSFGMVYEISDNGVLFARVKSVQVMVSLETKKSRPLNDLNKYLEN